MHFMKDTIITDVQVYVGNNKKPKDNPGKKYDTSWATESVIANPLSGYPEFYPRRSSWFGMTGGAFVVIKTNRGVEGYGMTTGDHASAAVIRHHYRKLLIGRSPYQIEQIWDILFRASLPYGRKGVAIMALSAVDLALWDCVAKLREEPLYVSLGGAVRESIPAYVTGNDFSETREINYVGQKLAMPYGPASGVDGMKKNVELVKYAREQLGNEREIMLDCYMGWNVEYTIRMAQLLEPYRVKWIEESLPPDDYAGYAELNRKITSTAIATGEHEFTRFGFQQLLDVNGAAIVQPDIYWCGGLTEAKKICAMASAKHIPVIPHGGGAQAWTIHLLFAEPGIPWAEYFLGAGTNDPIFTCAFDRVPEDGKLSLPEGIGSGLTLREDAYELLTEVL